MVERGRDSVRLWRQHGFRWPVLQRVPNSVRPGPAHQADPPVFILNTDNAERMIGRNDPLNERWADIAGNHYSTAFSAGFSYTASGKSAPRVFLRYDHRAPTLRGRIEAHGLKPNFAYQLKLCGDFNRDASAAEAIGYRGRWRLPAPVRQTNFADRDFRRFKPRENVEAYLFFDFFVTDSNGNAALDFELDNTLHVLWNRDRQRKPDTPADAIAFSVDASDPVTYARPKQTPSTERIWAERVHRRYRRANEAIRLPAGHYPSDIVLTEESFHARGRDGGFWATVFSLPVSFEILPDGRGSIPD